MLLHEHAGKTASGFKQVDLSKVISAYHDQSPQGPVSFGTSGHRGSSLRGTFNDMHVAAISQAICDYRSSQGIQGPLFMGFDTHALSEPAFRTALEVFAANQVTLMIHAGDEFTPTPVISFLVLEHNKANPRAQADGIVITPSHNPPRDGGFNYNPPHGGPADVDVTRWIEDRANRFMEKGNRDVRRVAYGKARRADTTFETDFMTPFIEALSDVIDLDIIRNAGIRIGVDPMGGAGTRFWAPIADRYGLNIQVVNETIDSTFSFMTLDFDGEIRMDCSSPYAMAGLIGMADRFDIAWGNDTDADRHGIVCPTGLMNPNHYLSVAIWYLLKNRPQWKRDLAVGKTLVSSSMIDRVVQGLGRPLYEVPVGFKWFVDGLLNGNLAFGGEESAGAAFLRKNGAVWTTDKDGFSLTLLAAEILARTGKNPDTLYRETLTRQYGAPFYRRADSPISDAQKTLLKTLSPDAIKKTHLAGLKITSVWTKAPGNDAPIGGIKVGLEDGSWFAVRPSGTEPKMKVYIESFGGEERWAQIHEEALPLIFG